MALAAFIVLMIKDLTYIGFRVIMYLSTVGSVLAEHTLLVIVCKQKQP